MALGTVWCTGSPVVLAQARRWEVVLPVDAQGAGGLVADRWARRLEHGYADAEAPLVMPDTLATVLELRTQTLERTDVEGLLAVEQHLLRARAHAAQLSESDALSELAAAEHVVVTLLHVPGAPAFYAEVETAIGLVAAQAGLDSLAIAALRRAAVVDPVRGVRAAETTPSWVDRAATIAREIAAGPQGEIAIDSNVAGAQVFVDDTLRGVTPMTLRATRGVHVLRVEATGHQTLGMLLPVDAGVRPHVHVALSRDRIDLALAALAHAVRERDMPAISAALRELQRIGAPIAAVWSLETSPQHRERALVTRCGADACEAPRRLELDPADATGEQFGQALDPAGFGRDRRARDQAWLRVSDNFAPPLRPAAARSHWWQRWYVWTAAAALLAGATAVGIAVSDEPDTRRLRVTVEP